jgi:serine/threonine protein kinase
MPTIIGKKFTVGPTIYTVVEEISSGGFGTVYRAETDAPFASPLAVKVPTDKVLASPEWKKRFTREARILGNINHRNVVRTLGLLEFPDKALLLVQEFVPGCKEFFTYPYSSDSEHLSLVLQTLYGLRATHGESAETRAVHRDLSPRNILIANRTAKIIDFGLAKEDPRETTVLTLAGQAFGTPGCTAPEQRSDAATVDHRADIYALGKSVASVLQHRHPEHVEIASLPLPWQPIITQMTAFSPDDRFADADAVISRLLWDFFQAGVTPDFGELHFDEFAAWKRHPPEWTQVATKLLTESSLVESSRLAMAYKVTPQLLADPNFDANAVLDSLLTKVIPVMFGASAGSFEACDPLGAMLVRWYPNLVPSLRVSAFRVLVGTAIAYHRYPVMSNVRDIFRLETDTATRKDLKVALDELDPSGVIESRGVIPGR